MSDWAIKVHKLESIIDCPNSDTLSIAKIGGWELVVKRGQYSVGDLVVYFPSDSLVPQEHLKNWGLEGKLSGSGKNRVKAVRLRGQISIGLLCKAPEGFIEGQDAQEYYGITKWEPSIPPELSGIAKRMPRGYIKYDIDNINNSPRMFDPTESVIVYEKCHGANSSCCLIDGEVFVTSRSVCLEESDTNTYWAAARNHDLINKIKSIQSLGKDIWIYGEVLPTQDLKYGYTKPGILFFDIRVDGRFLDNLTAKNIFKDLDLPMPPMLYDGPYDLEFIKLACQGQEGVSGKELHVREGGVIRPQIERQHRNGRAIAKYINPEYMVRKDGTEFH